MHAFKPLTHKASVSPAYTWEPPLQAIITTLSLTGSLANLCGFLIATVFAPRS
jgi:hypothetical protein